MKGNSNRNLIQKLGLVLLLLGLLIFNMLPFVGNYELTDATLKQQLKEEHYEVVSAELSSMLEEAYSSNFAFISDLNHYLDAYNDKLKAEGRENEIIWADYTFSLTKASTTGWIAGNKMLLFLATFGLSVLGGLIYIFPLHRKEPEGIKNDGIYHSSMKSRGIVGIITGSYLILLYIILYWFPEYLTNMTLIVDPLSIALSGSAASQWFLYGTIYTLAILVMGIRMFRKYRGNKYQTLRTASVMFFQFSFAFLIPEILVLLNKPWHDFKNIWPLDYTFFSITGLKVCSPVDRWECSC